jgi:hypothetical protein
MTFFSRRAQYITYAAISQKEEDMRKDIYIYYCNLHRKEGRRRYEERHLYLLLQFTSKGRERW